MVCMKLKLRVMIPRVFLHRLLSYVSSSEVCTDFCFPVFKQPRLTTFSFLRERVLSSDDKVVVPRYCVFRCACGKSCMGRLLSWHRLGSFFFFVYCICFLFHRSFDRNIIIKMNWNIIILVFKQQLFLFHFYGYCYNYELPICIKNCVASEAIFYRPFLKTQKQYCFWELRIISIDQSLEARIKEPFFFTFVMAYCLLSKPYKAVCPCQ